MKRMICASMPYGYLKTTRFTTPSLKTDDQKNAVEALEVSIVEKFDQFDKMCQISIAMTSDAGWQGTIKEFELGYYIQLEGTRSSFSSFVSDSGVIRKPRNAGNLICTYNISGNAGLVEYISRAYPAR